MIPRNEPPFESGISKGGWAGETAAAFAFWLLFVSLATTYASLARGYDYTLANFPGDLLLVTLGGLFSIGIQKLLRRATGSFLRQMVLAAVIVVAIAPLFEACFQTGLHLIGRVPQPPEIERILRLGLFWLAPFGLWTAMSLARLRDREARAHERRVAEFREQAHDAQLRALRYQVNPHFLYNTLNSIASLILDRRNDAAERMVLRLSDFFRTSLASNPLGDVPLADELALQKLYLDIEEVRFADSLRVEFEVSGEAAAAQVPSLILQPIVENVLKHGMNEAGTETLLRISARRTDDRLLVEVSDSGPGVSKVAGTGLGLANVRRRLEARYGGAARLDAEGVPGTGFRVRLDMPFVTP
jgi:two-component system, LytTR family, sensor kinase